MEAAEAAQGLTPVSAATLKVQTLTRTLTLALTLTWPQPQLER